MNDGCAVYKEKVIDLRKDNNSMKLMVAESLYKIKNNWFVRLVKSINFLFYSLISSVFVDLAYEVKIHWFVG